MVIDMGRIIKMPDQEYIAWVNLNKKAVAEMIKTNKIDPYWLAKGKNKEFLTRYLGELGYTLV